MANKLHSEFRCLMFLSLVLFSRQIDLNVNPHNNMISLGHQKTIVNSGGHQVQGYGSLSHQAVPGGASSVSGGLNYRHDSTGNFLDASITKSNRGLGTDTNVMGKVNIVNNDRARVDAIGEYSRNSRSGLESTAGKIQFTHPQSESGVNIGFQNTNRGVGSDVNVGAQINLYKSDDGKASLDMGTQYSKKHGSGVNLNYKVEF